jgi:hypothetical protein
MAWGSSVHSAPWFTKGAERDVKAMRDSIRDTMVRVWEAAASCLIPQLIGCVRWQDIALVCARLHISGQLQMTWPQAWAVFSRLITLAASGMKVDASRKIIKTLLLNFILKAEDHKSCQADGFGQGFVQFSAQRGRCTAKMP